MTNKQNADASESFRQLMAAYSKAFSSTPDSVKEEENADDTATTTENGTTPSPRTASILEADDETTETALEFNLERAKLLNRQKEQELEEQAQKIKRLKARNARRWLSIILRGILAVTAIVFVGIQLWNCNAIVSEYVAYMIHTDKESPVVIISWMATSLGEVVGILWVIARNLFPFHDKHRDREAEKQNPKQTQLEKDTMTHTSPKHWRTKITENRPGARRERPGRFRICGGRI